MEKSENVTRIERNPDFTRHRILEAAFMEIYRNGFQGMRLDEVLASTGLTKGALYHHFPNKRALGYAVVDEIILQTMDALWLQPLKNAADPYRELIEVIEMLPDRKPPEMIEYGCPLNTWHRKCHLWMRAFASVSTMFSVCGTTLPKKRWNGPRIRAAFDRISIATKAPPSLWPRWKAVSVLQKMLRALSGCVNVLMVW